MRRLFWFLVALAVLVAALAVADVVVRHRVQRTVASRIERSSPGSRATVRITSFPFVGRLAFGGQVPRLSAEVTDVRAGGIRFSRIRLSLVDLRVSRRQLVHGRIQVLSLRRGRVVAVVPQSEVDSAVHAPLELSPGRVGVGGLSAPVTLSVDRGRLTIAAGGLTSVSLPLPQLDVLPCVTTAHIEQRALRLSCRFHGVPSLLAGATFGA